MDDGVPFPKKQVPDPYYNYHLDKQTINEDGTYWAHRNITRLGASERDFSQDLSRCSSLNDRLNITLAQKMGEIAGVPVASEAMANPRNITTGKSIFIRKRTGKGIA